MMYNNHLYGNFQDIAHTNAASSKLVAIAPISFMAEGANPIAR